NGGSLGGPGSVSYNFDHKGEIIVEKGIDPDSEMLQLIDLGASDIEDNGKTLNVYVEPTHTHEVKQKIEDAKIKIQSTELIMKPKLYVDINDKDTAQALMTLLDLLEEHDDVQNVFENSNISDLVIAQL
ncbi:YebC/PmpR family DNA-binding transcriptional regulator, partial [Candidatus Microgenomates bacterium]|nr:YebC/PmpR family DNA-binding transcriptional regulator [Candidatus Microgenomates bacterium]